MSIRKHSSTYFQLFQSFQMEPDCSSGMCIGQLIASYCNRKLEYVCVSMTFYFNAFIMLHSQHFLSGLNSLLCSFTQILAKGK